jgi:type IV secretion system protein VirB10
MTDHVDPHASKISPDDPRLKPRLSKARHLRKGPTLIALALVVVAVAVSVAWAVEPRERRLRDDAVAADVRQPLPSEILDSPDVVRPPELPVDAGVAVPLKQSPQALVYDVPAATQTGRGVSAADTRRQKRLADYLKARGSDPFVTARQAPAVPTNSGEQAAPDGTAAQADARLRRSLQQAKQMVSGLSPAATPSDDIMVASADRGDGYLHAQLQRPRSPFEVKAGTVIPAVLQTAINSDLAGPVFAKVREAVYDSITHEYIVIPQNATLVAAYDSRIAWGQQRVLLCWQRLIFPNGTSLQLECMPGADLTGAAGLTDEVDEHWWRLAKGAGLASLLSAGTAAAAGSTTGYNPTMAQQMARGGAAEFARAGEQITRREMMVQPTITIRAGWSMNVLVTKDMVLEPYPIEPAESDSFLE